MKKFINTVYLFFTILFFPLTSVYAQISIKYFGGAERVSGSCSVLTVNKTSVITDCGSFYEENRLTADNAEVNDDIINADALVLTHAHNDHSGRIPYIIEKGFSGPIYLTHATKKLLFEIYNDGFGFDDIDRKYYWSLSKIANIKKQKRGMAALHWYNECKKTIKNTGYSDGLETKKEIEKRYGVKFKLCKKCLEKYLEKISKQFVSVNYLEKINISADIMFCFFDAGHIPGSASVLYYATDNNTERKIIISGDLGSGYSNLIDSGEPACKSDFVFAESTYGGVSKGVSLADYEQFQKDIGARLKDNKIVWIPSLALNRTQKILYEIKKGKDNGFIPEEVPVFSLSPTSNGITEQYENEIKNSSYNKWFKNEVYAAQTLLPKNYITKKQNEYTSPAIIISASGMMDKGVSSYLIKKLLPRKNVSVFLVSYAAPNTPAGRLKKGAKNIKTKYGKIEVLAEVGKYEIFSDHCDRNELIKWLSNQDKNKTKIYLIHGEADTLKQSCSFLKQYGYKNVEIVNSKKIILN